MNKLAVIEEHECEILRKFKFDLRKREIAIQKLSDMGWYWVRWSDKGNVAEGIGYCPYCGEKLNQLMRIEGGTRSIDLAKVHDMALDYENYVVIDSEHLWEKRAEMYKKGDLEVLSEVIPSLNAIIEDAEKYKSWILEQFHK